MEMLPTDSLGGRKERRRQRRYKNAAKPAGQETAIVVDP